NRFAVLRIQYGVGALLSLAVTLVSGERIIRTVSLRGTILTFVFAAVLMIASNLLLYGYQHFDVNIATVILATELIFGALFGFILFHEVPQPHELVGGLLIFTGSVLAGLNLDAAPHRSKT
ncbi:MAG TPA: EamA family transporter, partial [Candidatus Saccharimonadales bacterium]